MKTLLTLSVFAMVLAATSAGADSVWDNPTINYDGSREITVYRNPACGCCTGWIEHLKKHKFKVTDIMTDDLASIKQSNNVPAKMASCHTAIIDGYVIEGHVPAGDILHLLKTKPNLAGLAVPQMPVGSPGMEMGERKDRFTVFGIDRGGNPGPYNQYWDY